MEVGYTELSNLQKLITPSVMSTTAAPTKYGPAAPVTLSPIRSSHLKQRKTRRAHAMVGEMVYVETECLVGM
jgi:hypothetical protein